MNKTGFKHFRIIAVSLIILILGTAVFVSCASKDSSYSGNGFGESYPGADGSPDIDSGGVSGGIGDIGEIERKIIKSAEIRSETKYFDDALSALNDLCRNCGGYTENSSVSGNGVSERDTARTAQYTFRIPSEKFDVFVTNIGDIMNVTNSSVKALEITDEYYDTVSRMRVLETQRDSLEKMLGSFDDYSDMESMLKVQDKLYEVIQEIEAFKAKLNLYDSMVSYSEIQVWVYEVVEYSGIGGAQSFGDRISKAFTESWKSFGRGCQNFAVFIVRAFPVLLVLAAVSAVIIIIAVKSSKKQSKKQKAAMFEETKENKNGRDK